MIWSELSKAKHTQATQPARHHINVLGQLLKFIPRHIIRTAARETGVDLKTRTYSELSHLGTMIFAQLAHAMSLNDVCDWRNLPVVKGCSIVRDQIVKLTGARCKKLAGWSVRRVEAWVEVDGKERLMVFISNNTAWSPRSVCDLYRARWDIEVFFKQVKQTLKLGDFLGYNANAIRWQVWTALLVYVLLRT